MKWDIIELSTFLKIISFKWQINAWRQFLSILRWGKNKLLEKEKRMKKNSLIENTIIITGTEKFQGKPINEMK